MHGGLMTKEKNDPKEKVEDKQEKQNVFIIKQTDTTGVYNLETIDGKSMGEAHIPNLKMSKVVRKACNDNDRVLFHCIKNDKFNKWELKELIS